MKTQRLISSYDEINDIFYGKIDGKNGYFANYAVNKGIFINIDKNGFPVSFFINHASNVLHISKEILEESNVKVGIDCDNISIIFNIFINNVKIYNGKFENNYKIPAFNFMLDTNY
ncbi:hypothetical protein [uncultured Methanobrevibacter sp.]|uniref:hypothetical protein n=1 Tax=uncultured Methanobrevibacter sp. TaxID=253161 RepID=UPI00263894A0|nr:hypothetical protein [uncultured Methanobrevibacter sp.]